MKRSIVLALPPGELTVEQVDLRPSELLIATCCFRRHIALEVSIVCCIRIPFSARKEFRCRSRLAELSSRTIWLRKLDSSKTASERANRAAGCLPSALGSVKTKSRPLEARPNYTGNLYLLSAPSTQNNSPFESLLFFKEGANQLAKPNGPPILSRAT